jgi:hypothetical protein
VLYVSLIPLLTRWSQSFQMALSKERAICRLEIRGIRFPWGVTMGLRRNHLNRHGVTGLSRLSEAGRGIMGVPFSPFVNFLITGDENLIVPPRGCESSLQPRCGSYGSVIRRF